MKKPAKILLATALLVFAAAGFYYAWMSPAKKPASSAPSPLVVRRDPVGPRVPAETAGRDLRESATMDRAAMPTPVPAPASGAASNPEATRAASSGAAGLPEGFRATSAPAGSLPDRLEGFDKAPAGESGSVTTTTRPQTTPPPATAPATGAPAPAAGNPAPLPPLPAPGSAVNPRPASTPPAAMPPAPVKPTAPVKPVETTYTVKAGDSLSSIWKQLTGGERGWEKLQSANPGLDPSRLKIGQVLKVPPFEAIAPAAAPVVAGPGDYIVKEGDTLSSIAADRLGASKRWKEIYDANKSAIGADPAALKVGMKLVIPGQTPARPAAPVTPAAPASTKPAATGSNPPPVTMPPALPSMPGPGTPPPASTPSPDSKGGAPGSPPPAPRST